MVDFAEVVEGPPLRGSMHGRFCRGGGGVYALSMLVRWGGATTLGGTYAWSILSRFGRDLYMVDFAEVGEGPPPWGDLCMVDLVEVREGSVHGRPCRGGRGAAA